MTCFKLLSVHCFLNSEDDQYGKLVGTAETSDYAFRRSNLTSSLKLSYKVELALKVTETLILKI